MLDQNLSGAATSPEEFKDPRWARFLFASSGPVVWLWLIIRLYMAYVYIPAGWEKITSGKWLFGDGAPIMNLVNGAIASDGTPAWYVWFLQNVVTPLAGLFATMVARRYSRAKPSTPVIARSNFAWRAIVYRLKAKIDIRPIAEEEVKASGWDRGDYA